MTLKLPRIFRREELEITIHGTRDSKRSSKHRKKKNTDHREIGVGGIMRMDESMDGQTDRWTDRQRKKGNLRSNG